MPIPVYLIWVGLGVLAATALAVLWQQVLGWAEASLLPWIDEHLPLLSGPARSAFVALDRVAVAVRVAAKKAWQDLRGYLLKQVVRIRKKTGIKALVLVEEWLRPRAESETVVHRISEREVEWEDLPEDVREAFLKRTEESIEKDVTSARDTEMMQLVLEE